MKKIALTALSALLLFGAVGCGPKFSEEVLKHPEGFTVHNVGGYSGVWAGQDDNKMEATSVKAVSEVSNDVASKLAKKDLKWLYMKKGIEIGTSDAGWSAKFKKDGKIYTANGSYTAKALVCSYVADEQTYANEQWISDPKTGYCESLTPETLFFPTWQEEADEDGFAWDQNPVVTGGAGVYTMVVCQYKTTSAPGKPGFGMAFVKESEKTGPAYEEVVDFVAKDHSYGLIGVGGNWDTDAAALTKVSDNEFKLEGQALTAEGVKIRADGKWDFSWGFSSLDAASKELAEDADGNFKVKVAGTYTIVIKNFGKDASAVVTLTKTA